MIIFWKIIINKEYIYKDGKEKNIYTLSIKLLKMDYFMNSDVRIDPVKEELNMIYKYKSYENFIRR